MLDLLKVMQWKRNPKKRDLEYKGKDGFMMSLSGLVGSKVFELYRFLSILSTCVRLRYQT